MSYSIGDIGRAVAHVDQDGDVAVAKVVQANPLNSSYLVASFHLFAEVALGEPLEDPFVIRDMKEEPHVFFDLLSQEPRYPESPVGLLGLRRADDVLAASPVHGLADIEVALLEVEVGWRQRQKLALPYACLVQYFEGVI